MHFVQSISYDTRLHRDPDGYLRLEGSNTPLENLSHELIVNQNARPVIALDPLLAEEDREQALKVFGFSEEALQKIYAHFQRGREGILEGLENGTIQLHRIGFSKPEKGIPEPKFYLVIQDQEDEGAVNKFFRGYSRKGTSRAITTYNPIEKVSIEPVEDLSRSSNPYHECICRVQGHERGIKVSELGGENLFQLDIAIFPKRERWALYMHLIWLLMNLHASGYAHGDIKLENIVIVKDDFGQIVGLKFIDLDTLVKPGNEILSATLAYCPPDQIKGCLREWQTSKTLRLVARTEDDIWAMMGLICELEWKAVSNDVDLESKALISPRILQHWNQYIEEMFDQTPKNQAEIDPFLQQGVARFNAQFPGLEGSFFEGLEDGYPLDPLMVAMSGLKSEARGSASQLFETHFRAVPETFDPIPPLVSEKSEGSKAESKGTSYWSSFKRGLARLFRCLCCCIPFFKR